MTSPTTEQVKYLRATPLRVSYARTETVVEIVGSTLCINDPRNLPTINTALNAISPQAKQHPAKQRQLIRKQETNKSLPFVITKGNFILSSRLQRSRTGATFRTLSFAQSAQSRTQNLESFNKL
jgi:hypothetical protein